MRTIATTALLLLTICVAPVSAQSPSLTPSPVPSSAPGVAFPAPSVAPLAWTAVAQDGVHPRAREDHTLTADPGGRAAYLFGGREADGNALGDLWRLDLDTDSWERLRPEGDGPRPRFGHTATWVPGVGLVVWAGQRGQTFFDDLWAFEPTSGKWIRISSDGPRPRARYGSCAALGPDGRLWISHGFTDDLGRFDDTWAFDFARDRWSDETPRGDVPGRRCLHDCIFTPDGRFLLYAGQTTGVPALRDLWSRAGSTRGGPSKPAPNQLRGSCTPWQSAARRRSFSAVTASTGDPLGDLWQLGLDTLTWRELHADDDGPTARSGATLIADDARSRLLLFGGRAGGQAFDDLWVLSTASGSPAADPTMVP